MTPASGTSGYDPSSTPASAPNANAAQLTPAAWLQFLSAKLDQQAADIKAFDDYYNGQHRLAFATAKFREAFSRFFPPLADNWMKLVVDAPVSRLSVTGFRFSGGPNQPTWEQEADEEAWGIWQASNFDSVSDLVHTEAVKLGVGYVLVQPPVPGWSDEPILTAEHPSQCIVYCNPANPRERLAGLKRWVSEIDGYVYATLYLPSTLYKWRSAEKFRPTQTSKQIQWTQNVPDPVSANPVGVVPLVAIENNPDMMWGGRSDLEPAIPIQDAINKFCLDMQVSAEFHAYPQRWATGWERSYDPAGRELVGREVDLQQGQTRFIRGESPETKFGQFTAGDVQNYIAPLDMYVEHLAAVTQTPAYYLKGKMANLSADAMHAADQGLVDRCRKKIRHFSDGWEDVMRCAFLAKGDADRGKSMDAEAMWADPESKSLMVLTQSLVQMRQALDMPLEIVYEMLGFSPQKIQQTLKLIEEEKAEKLKAAQQAFSDQTPPWEQATSTDGPQQQAGDNQYSQNAPAQAGGPKEL